jgi:anti-anti-sigma factor
METMARPRDARLATVAPEIWGAAFDVEWDGPDVVGRLSGEFDLATAHVIDDLTRTVAGGGASLLVDLQGVRFLDVIAARALMRCHETLRHRYRTVTFAGVQPAAWTVLKVTGLEKLLPLADGRLYGFRERARCTTAP